MDQPRWLLDQPTLTIDQKKQVLSAKGWRSFTFTHPSTTGPWCYDLVDLRIEGGTTASDACRQWHWKVHEICWQISVQLYIIFIMIIFIHHNHTAYISYLTQISHTRYRIDMFCIINMHRSFPATVALSPTFSSSPKKGWLVSSAGVVWYLWVFGSRVSWPAIDHAQCVV